MLRSGRSTQLREMLVPEDVPDEDYVVYCVLDALTDAVFPVIDRVEQRIDALEAPGAAAARTAT